MKAQVALRPAREFRLGDLVVAQRGAFCQNGYERGRKKLEAFFAFSGIAADSTRAGQHVIEQGHQVCRGTRK